MPSQPYYDIVGDAFAGNNTSFRPPARGSIILDPPVSRPSGRSPLKCVRQAIHSPAKSSLKNNAGTSLPPPQAIPFDTDSPLRRPSAPTFHPIAPHNSLKPIFATFSSAGSSDKENVNPKYHSDNIAEFPDPSHGFKAPLKRATGNTIQQQDPLTKKGCLEESDILDPEKMTLVPDDGRKPPYSYAALIGMSILRAPGRRLTLAQIYKWISDTFSYYRLPETGWQNSIRHNLSLNKAFIKQERPKDDPGKGNYWAIEPGMEDQFAKDKPTRRPTSSSAPNFKSSSVLSSEANMWPSQLLPPPPPKASPKPIVRASETFEPSSDATIPASDAPSQDEEVDEAVNMPPPTLRLPMSSPLQTFHSSPPISHQIVLRNDTPSPEVEISLPSSNLRSRKRRLDAMDDSGYFSSLDSSATRPFTDPRLPELRTDRPRIKRGRAEEEIARIRSSSHDISPSKGRSFLKQPTPTLISSSPLRHFDNSLMLPPLTPAVKFKLPSKPPASISPNTNLRNHRNRIRELVGSPVKNTALFSDDVSFSPAFNIVDDERIMFEDEYPSFSIFTDSNEDGCRRPASASPIKRSVRRSRTDRASKISHILADVTGTSKNSKASMNAMVPSFESPKGFRRLVAARMVLVGPQGLLLQHGILRAFETCFSMQRVV